MRRTLAVVLVAVAAILGLILATRGPASPPPPVAAPIAAPPAPAEPPIVKPARPPGPDDPHPPPPAEPQMPTPGASWKDALAARVARSPNPGELAFRAYSDLFVDENLPFAERQAAQEGISVAEVRELTHFGLLVLATQRVPEIEELLGHELGEEAQTALAELMHTSNDRFKQEMRALVARGAPQSERAKLVRDTDAAYRRRYFEITGMTPALLDDLLAGDLLLPGAPASLEPPSGAPAEGGKDEVVAPVRPAN